MQPPVENLDTPVAVPDPAPEAGSSHFGWRRLYPPPSPATTKAARTENPKSESRNPKVRRLPSPLRFRISDFEFRILNSHEMFAQPLEVWSNRRCLPADARARPRLAVGSVVRSIPCEPAGDDSFPFPAIRHSSARFRRSRHGFGPVGFGDSGQLWRRDIRRRARLHPDRPLGRFSYSLPGPLASAALAPAERRLLS